jgi:hypothetical protein
MEKLASRAVSDGHPYTIRFAAQAMAQGHLMQHVRPQDALLQQMLRQIVRGSDDVARETIVEALVQTVPPTQTSSALLRMAAEELGPNTQLRALNALLKGKISRGRLQAILRSANRMLQNDAGPPPEKVLRMLEKALSTRLEHMEGGKAEGVFLQVVSGVRFSEIPAARRHRAIVFVVERAPKSRLAAAWLDRRLLGAADRAIVRRTLRVLQTADTGSGVLRPTVQTLMDGLFGAPTEGTGEWARLSDPIPLASAQHSIFAAVQSGDERIREAAWRVLPMFEVESGARAGAEEQEGEGPQQVYEAVMRTALNQQPTPTAVVRFLKAQPHDRPVAEALVRVVVEGSPDSDAVRQAANAMLGSALPLDRVLGHMETRGNRHGFAQAMYRALRGRAPRVTGLLLERSQDAQAARWFGAEVAEGRLPEASAWVEAFTGPDTVLEMTTSADRSLANGAVAALVASVGGSEVQMRRVADALRRQGGNSVQKLRAAWHEQRRQILLERVEGLAGPYRMRVQVGKPDEVGAQRSIGVVQLRVRDGQVELGRSDVPLALAEGRLALEISDPVSLKNLADAGLADLPLGEVSDPPITLAHRPDGTWSGQARLGDGRQFGLVLKPAP